MNDPATWRASSWSSAASLARTTRPTPRSVISAMIPSNPKMNAYCPQSSGDSVRAITTVPAQPNTAVMILLTTRMEELVTSDRLCECSAGLSRLGSVTGAWPVPRQP